MANLHTHMQASAYDSPWTLRGRIKQFLWEYTWAILCSWTPKPLNFWRLWILRCFGAKIEGTPFVHQRARIQQPWKLTLRHRACLGDRASAYTLDKIVIDEGATIAQEAYICTGTHDFSDSKLPLQTAPIYIGKNAFIGLRAVILPGVSIGDYSIVGACAVVTKTCPARATIVGNPAKVIKIAKEAEK